MMARLGGVCCGFLVIMMIWSYSGVDAGTPIGQGNRLFGDVCRNCIVSDGMGFITDPDDCSCYFTCVLVRSYKLSSMASPWVSTKRCCPCGMSWSMKLLTCLDYRDNRTECYREYDTDTNPCLGATSGDLVPRSNPIQFNPTPMCAGFNLCQTVDGRVVPSTDCCDPGFCFEDATETCTETACDMSLNCAASDAENDCTKPTPAPTTECLYMAVPGDNTMFMGKENMIMFTCAAGTIWDDVLCACKADPDLVIVDVCDLPFIAMDFADDVLEVVDRQGNEIWAEAVDTLITEFAVLQDGYINIGGAANTFLSNNLALRIEFTLTEDDGSSDGQTQCLMGNCLEAETSTGTDSFSITVDRINSGSDADEIDISLTYQDEVDMSGVGGGMETVSLNVEGDFEVGTAYELWLIYAGDQEFLVTGVLTAGETAEQLVTETDIGANVEDSIQVLMGQSGFVFGDCPSGDPFEGLLTKVEFWRECFPDGVAEYLTAVSAINE